MITRKNRKQSLKVREMKEIEEQLESDGERDRKRVVRIFLESWLEAKQQLIQNGSLDEPNETIHDAISRKLVAKGLNISSKLALNKTATFYKKYQFVRKCEQQGKKIEWANYDIVKKIFDLSEPISEPTVMIPVNNIKSEDELTIIEEAMVGVDEKNCSNAKASNAQLQRKQMKAAAAVTKNKPTVKTEVNSEVELVAIGNDRNSSSIDDPTKNSIERSSSFQDDDSEISDLDDELDFENPLDNITLRLPGAASTPKSNQSADQQSNATATSSSSSMPPPTKRIKRDSIELKRVSTPPLTQNKVKLHKIPNIASKLTLKTEGGKITPPVAPTAAAVPLTMPGLKPGEFLIPTGTTKPGQKQQFLVVKRLPLDGSTSTATLNGKDSRFNQAGGNGAAATSGSIRCITPQMRIASTPPPQPSPSQSPFMISNTPPPSQLSVSAKTIQIPMPNLQASNQSQSQETTVLLAKLFDMHSAIKSIEKERLELEQKRYESELEHQKELISIFKDIRDKLCDKPKKEDETT